MESVEAAIHRAQNLRPRTPPPPEDVQDLVRRIEDLATMPSGAPAHVAHSKPGALAQALSRWLPPLVEEMAGGLGLKTRTPLVEVTPDGHLLIRLEEK